MEISKHSIIKRSTIYLVIESLIKKNLVRVLLKGRKKLYIAENPELMLKLFEEKKKHLEMIVPLLKERYSESADKPRVNFYEGRDGVEKVYKEVQASKTESLWYGSADDMLSEFPDFYHKMIALQESKDFPGMRDITNYTRKNVEYARERNTNKTANIKVRLLPHELYFLNSDNIIYDNKVAILSINRDFFAIIIESKTVADAYRCMYEMAWKSAIKP